MARPQRIEPRPGQESVWDYPRPPRVEDSAKRIRVLFNGVTVAETRRARRVLETSSPPVYYIPPEDVRMDLLTPARRTTFCEWKVFKTLPEGCCYLVLSDPFLQLRGRR